MRGTYADPTANEAIARVDRERRRQALEEARKQQYPEQTKAPRENPPETEKARTGKWVHFKRMP